MACSSCRKATPIRRPSFTGGSTVIPNPMHVNRPVGQASISPQATSSQAARDKIMSLRYVPK